MKKKINTAVVGYGLSGQAFHAPFLHVNEGFELRRVVERNRAESKKTYPYVEVTGDLDEVLADPEVELVVICTPNIHHFEQVTRCLEAGKHVVVEKPFMNTSGDCDTVIRMAAERGLHLFVFHNRRWDGDFLTIRKVLDSGVLGVLQYYEAHFDRYAPERKRAAWRDEQLAGSGILFDLGPHLIDQVLVLFGPPVTVEADIRAERAGSLVDDYFRIRLGYPGMEAVVTAGMLVEDHRLRYVLHGAAGSYIKYGTDPQEARLRQGDMPGGEGWGREDPGNYGLITFEDEFEDYDGKVETLPGNYMAFYENVHAVLTGDAAPAITPAEARDVIRIIELARESNERGEAIQVDHEDLSSLHQSMEIK